MLASHDFDSLNAAQREAVGHGETKPAGGVAAGPLLVIAGAGTGKTNTLAHRVAHLVLAGVPPERILLLTFTRRAALEMTRRAQRRSRRRCAPGRPSQPVPAALRLPWSGTFHSIGNRLIRQHAAAARARSGLQRARPRRRGRPDGRGAPRLGLAKTEKRFPRKDTCLAIYSHRVNTQRPLAERSSTVPLVRRMGGRSSRSCAASTSRPSSRSRCSTTTTCCSTGTR